MAGGEIKNTLTLDVSKFSSALDRAISGTNDLEKHLKSAAKVAADFDKGMGQLGSNFAETASRFRMLDQTVENLASKLVSIGGRFDDIGRHSTGATRGVEQLGTAMRRVSGLNADAWIKKYADELDALAPAIRNAVSSIVDLDRANIASAATAEKAADKTAAAKLKTLEAEREANRKIIAEREKLAAELLTIQQTMQKRADSNTAVAANYFGKNYKYGDPYRQEAAQAMSAVNAAREEAAAVESVIKELRWKNGEIEKSINLIHQEAAAAELSAKIQNTNAQLAKDARRAEQAAATAAKQAAAESAAAAREAAAERMRAAREAAAYERQQAQQLAQMWKGMGQLWAASKIERGLSAGVGKASEYQQAEMRVKLLNLPTEEFEEFKKKAFDISREEKYISVIETMQSRLDAVTAIGANHAEVIDQTLQSALRNAQVLMSAGYEHGNRSDLIKNLYGFAEARQVMNDPAKIIESFDIIRRVSTASGGKLNIADFETVARNMGDLRQTMTKDGWFGIASLMEQFKVAGSQGQGGAGAGVSSVGTMLKMMSLYGSGKPVTNQAAVQLLGADVMNSVSSGDAGAFNDSKQTSEAFRRAIKTAGFKGVKEMSQDPVTFFAGLRDQILDYTKTGKAKDKFYTDGDTTSDAAESAALKQFFAKMGMSNKTVDGMLTMMNKAFIERKENVGTLAKNADDESKSVERMRDTWKNAVDEMKAGAENLAVAFTPLLEPLSAIPRAIGGILNKAAEFVKNNPLTGMFDLALVALGGFTLAIKGTLSTFGMFGSTFGAVRTILGSGEAAVVAATSSWSGLRAMVLAVGLAFPSLTGAMDVAIGYVSRVAGALLAPFASVAAGASGALGWLARLSGGLLGFIARWASPAGWAVLAGQMGWVIGEWISSLEIGGLTIGERMQNMFLDIELGWKGTLLNIKEKWFDFLKLVGGEDYLAESADRKELQAERDALAKRRADMTIKARPELEGPPVPTSEDKPTPKKTKEGGKPKEVEDPFAKPPRVDRVFENAFQRSLEQMVGRQTIDSLKLGTVLSGEGSYEQQAAAAFKEKWLGGDFDDGKDPSKRKFVKGGAKYDKTKGWSLDNLDMNATDQTVDFIDPRTGEKRKATIKDWLEAYAAGKKLEDQIKAVTFASERAAAADEESSVALDRLTGKTDGQTDAMKALNREFAREEARNPAAVGDTNYQDRKGKALAGRATADYANMGADLVEKNRQLEASFLQTERERLEASTQATYLAKRKEVDIVMKALDDQVKALEAAGKQGSDEYLKAVKAREEGEANFTKYLQNIAKEREEALLLPIERMAREWKDTYKTLNDLEVSWANGFIENLSKVINGGTSDWRGFLAGMANDLSKMFLKEAFADGMKSVFKGFNSAIKPLMGAASGGGKDGASGSILGGLGEIFGKVTDGVKGFWDALTGSTAAVDKNTSSIFDSIIQWARGLIVTETKTAADSSGVSAMASLTASAYAASAALDAVAMSGGGGGGGGGIGDLFDLFGGSAGMGGAQSAEELAIAADLMDTAFIAKGGWFHGAASNIAAFANGGAFTNSVIDVPTLFKFANGGKFGLMGEAGPEAVMPLARDGQGRLGVMANGAGGAGGSMVNISIVVNKDGSASAAQDGESPSDDAMVWRRMADQVKRVVMDQLVQQQRPGGVLYR